MPAELIPDPGPDRILVPGHDLRIPLRERIAGVAYLPWKNAPKKWLVGAFIAFCFVNLLMLAAVCAVYAGVGIWGMNIPIGWGFAIINFVWWIGIGHAGTLISAILFLLKQDWRTSINRFSEAMTLFAVACAGMFPILHLGRPWLAYWLFPYPNTMWLWPQPRSPLEWDVFAVSTYGTVSLVFWYIGLIPDLATMRDHAPKPWRRSVYGVLGARLARFGHPLASLSEGLSAVGRSGHAAGSLRSHRSSASISPSALFPAGTPRSFPPYFVAGAIYSGFAMVLTLDHSTCGPGTTCRTSSPCATSRRRPS